jgi:hypothetical protein
VNSRTQPRPLLFVLRALDPDLRPFCCSDKAVSSPYFPFPTLGSATAALRAAFWPASCAHPLHRTLPHTSTGCIRLPERRSPGSGRRTLACRPRGGSASHRAVRIVDVQNILQHSMLLPCLARVCPRPSPLRLPAAATAAGMLVLFESAAGYLLFKVLDEGKLKNLDDLNAAFQSPEKASKVYVRALLRNPTPLH